MNKRRMRNKEQKRYGEEATAYTAVFGFEVVERIVH